MNECRPIPVDQRVERFRSPRLLRAAAHRSCVLCGKNDGTTVAAHLPGSYYGQAAGHGQKTHDWLVAHLCDTCHAYIDSAEGRRDTETRMRVLCRTLQRNFDEGVLRSL